MPATLPRIALICFLFTAPFVHPGGRDEGTDLGALPERRNRMMEQHIVGRGITDVRVLEAMRKVPRHEFVPSGLRSSAYDDNPLPIGYGQTISQPYIVAFMTEAIKPKKNFKVLEIGTGSGYQAAVLAEAAGEVFSVEIVPELGEAAARRLERLGRDSVRVKVDDGYYGWKEEAPFDAVIVTAAADHVPPALIEQLANGGRLIIPLGGVFEVQSLVLVEKSQDGRSVTRKSLLPVRFVPLTRAVRRK